MTGVNPGPGAVASLPFLASRPPVRNANASHTRPNSVHRACSARDRSTRGRAATARSPLRRSPREQDERHHHPNQHERAAAQPEVAQGNKAIVDELRWARSLRRERSLAGIIGPGQRRLAAAGKLREGANETEIVVRLSEKDRANPESLAALEVFTPSGPRAIGDVAALIHHRDDVHRAEKMIGGVVIHVDQRKAAARSDEILGPSDRRGIDDEDGQVAEPAETHAFEHAGRYDVVTCMEMLEHVPDPAAVVRALAALVVPGGHVFVSTLNRTPRAYLMAILGAEYVLRLLPPGTHTYEKFIRPSELAAWARAAGLTQVDIAGLDYEPFSRKSRLTDDAGVNYLMHFCKPEAGGRVAS